MFKFAWPYVFILLPLFWLVPKIFSKSQQNNQAMLRVPFLSRIKALHQSRAAYAHTDYLTTILRIAAWLTLLIACANPQWLGDPVPVIQDSHNIMLAVDLSPSMKIPDLQRNNHMINRLQTVKEVAADFITKRQGDKLGLIVFGSKAYLQTPLTFDRKTLSNMLDDETVGLAGQSTAIGDAVGLAIKKLSTENIKSRILILLTDGGNNSGTIDPVAAAHLAKDNHIKIYTIGIGASQLMVNGFFGNQMVNPSADLDENLLKSISSITEGQYFRAQDAKTLASILDAINQLEPINTENKTARQVAPLFYWPLAFSLLFFALLIFPNFKKMIRL
jgi:Ca-activated chloride channel family protein